MEVFIATKNEGKVREIASMLTDKGVTVKSILDLTEPIEIEETGITFAENAILKAETMSQKLGSTVIADDSGLSVDALNGRPGVYSARYAGEHTTDQENIDKLLVELAGVPVNNRTARFHCALAVASPGIETAVFHGECEGVILEKQQGTGGFGYDPVFFVPEFGKTMAELTKAEKNSISHRGKTLNELQENWQVLFAGDCM